MVCTFFGHKDTPYEVGGILREKIIEMIEVIHCNLFYVGNNGNFDRMVKQILIELKVIYPQINYFVVLPYLPTDKNDDYSDSIVPENIENVFPKYAILKRNEWMLDKSDYVITYVKHQFGGAYKFFSLAKKRGKVVINIVS